MKRLFIVLLLIGNTALAGEDLSAEAAAPYLGMYWGEPLRKPLFIVFEKNHLAVELPWKGLRELEKTTEADLWSYVADPENLVKFHRVGDRR